MSAAAALSDTGPIVLFHRSANALSSDHQLITLIYHNLFRAFLTNMFLLQLPNIFTCTVNVEDHLGVPPLPLPGTMPPSLEPTRLQLTVPHPPWVDLFPVAGVRDTAIRRMSQIDDCDLCIDMLGAKLKPSPPQRKLITSTEVKSELSEDPDERKGLIVWGDPWVVGSWEVSEGFMRKWGWLLREGTEELLQSTNRWRALRGERPLVWQIE